MQYKFLFLLLAGFFSLLSCSEDECNNLAGSENPADQPYYVNINPADFKSSEINGNSYFPINTGSVHVYQGENEDGQHVDIEEKVLEQTKQVMGVTCVVVEFKEWEDGELVEIALDWYGQDLKGNVWYFGEDVENYENGELKDKDGSWEAGVDGALPGIAMFADPLPGVWYRQEFYKGEAEDASQILSIGDTATTPAGTFENCLKSADWTPLEPGIVEHKYYAPGIGTVKIEKAEGTTGYEELVEIR